MYKDYTILATVCARGGSKGVKNKNIRPLGGKPLIYYTLDILRDTNMIDDYVISTDSKSIINLVIQYGFEVHFKRPAHLAHDKVPRIEAVRHAVHWMEQHFGKKWDIIVDLGVATPLKTAYDVENAIKLLVNENASNVISVTYPERNPYYNMIEVVNGMPKLVKEPPLRITDRRDAPRVFSMNDAINVWWRDVLFSSSPMFNKDTKLYVMPRERSIDIDDEFDFMIAECIVKTMGGVMDEGKFI